MADVLGAASVVLSVTGEGELSADLAAAVARLEMVEDAANSARSAASKVAEAGGPESMGVPASRSGTGGGGGGGSGGSGGGGGTGRGSGGSSTTPIPVTVESTSKTVEKGGTTGTGRPGGPAGPGVAPATNRTTAGTTGGPGGSRTAMPVAVTNRPLIVRVEGPVAIRPPRQGVGNAGMGVAASVAAGAGMGPGGVAGIGDGLRGAANDTKKLKEQMASLGSVMASTFATGTASIFGLVAAADPSMFSTFQSSVRLAAIEVGQAFVPYVESAARGLQQFAGWFSSVDAGTKGTIAKIALTTTVLAGVAVAAKVAAVAFGGLGTAVVNTGRLMSLGLLSNPVTAGILGVTTLVGGLAAAWWGVSKAVDAAGSGMGRTAAQRVAGGPGQDGKPTLQQLLNELPERKRNAFLAIQDPKKLREAIDEEIKTVEATIQVEREKTPARIRQEDEAAMERYKRFVFFQEGHRALYDRKLEEYRKEYDDPKADSIPAKARRGAFGKVDFVPQFYQMKEERDRIVDILRKRDPEVTEAELDVFGEFKAAAGTLRMYAPPELKRPIPREVNTEEIKRLEAGRTSLQKIRDEIGADGFKQDLKLPFQSHYTNFEAYQESLQIKALDGNTAQTAADINAMRNTLERMKEGLDRGISATESTAAVLKILQSIFGG